MRRTVPVDVLPKVSVGCIQWEGEEQGLPVPAEWIDGLKGW